MFELSNIKITNSKIDESSVNSNGFWFTPINGEFNINGVAEFVTRELPSPMWLNRKMFPHLNHLFVTESQTNLFMALCPFVRINGYSFELKHNRIIGGHQLHVIKADYDEHTDEEEEIPLTYSAEVPYGSEEKQEEKASGQSEDTKPTDQSEPQSGEQTNMEEQEEGAQEESTTSRKPKKK